MIGEFDYISITMNSAHSQRGVYRPIHTHIIYIVLEVTSGPFVQVTAWQHTGKYSPLITDPVS